MTTASPGAGAALPRTTLCFARSSGLQATSKWVRARSQSAWAVRSPVALRWARRSSRLYPLGPSALDAAEPMARAARAAGLYRGLGGLQGPRTRARATRRARDQAGATANERTPIEAGGRDRRAPS